MIQLIIQNYQCLSMPLYYKYYLMEWIVNSDMKKQKQKNILLDIIHIIFLKGTLKETNDIQFHVQRINDVQKKMTKFKKDDRLLHHKSMFFIASKGVFRHLILKKSLKTFITQYIYFVLDLLCKHISLLTIVVDDSIF